MIKLAREKSLRVADVMVKDVVIIDVRTTIDVAAAILTERRIGGAPVVAPSGEPVGIVTRADLLSPRHDGTVEGAMTRVLYAVRPTDPLMTAVRLMAAEQIHRVVVVDERGAIAGILTSMDVVRALARESPHEEVPLEFVKLRRA